MGASSSMAESGCGVMGDLLHFVGSGAFDTPNLDPWPLLTYPFIDPLRQVESLEQSPAPARLYGWRRRIIYPVRGLTVKGILPHRRSKNP
jgi:hypothetical protein